MRKLTIKKAAAVLLAALTAFALAACGGDPGKTTAAPETTAATKAVIDITTAAETTEAPTTAPETTVPETTPAPTETEAPTEAPTTEESTAAPETTAAQPDPFGEEDLVLTVDGVDLTLGMDFAPVAGQILGGVYDEQVGQACVGGGNDRAYLYGGEEVCVYTVGSASGAQTVYDIYIDGVQGFSTAKGAVIGASTRTEVLAVYGEPSFSSLAADRYSVGDFDLIFGFDDYDILSSVGLHDNAVQ